jgi:hypothetical protein
MNKTEYDQLVMGANALIMMKNEKSCSAYYGLVFVKEGE